MLSANAESGAARAELPDLVRVMRTPTRILFSLRMGGSEPIPLINAHAVAHSDFTDPQGPLLTS